MEERVTWFGKASFAAMLAFLTATPGMAGECRPTILGSIGGGPAEDVEVVGSTAFVANGSGGLLTVDVADPANPTVLGSVRTAGFAESVTFAGGAAYVAGSRGLEVVDVGNPANPVLVGRGGFAGSKAVAVSGSIAYVATGDVGPVQVIDIENPANLTPLASVGSGTDLAVSGDVIYVAGSRGLQVIDVTERSKPTLLSSVDTQGSEPRVAVSKGIAYVAAGSRLWVIDVEDTTNPTTIGWLDTPSGDVAADVTLSENFAYLATEDGGLHVIDVGDPASPALLGSVETPGPAHGVSVSGGRRLPRGGPLRASGHRCRGPDDSYTSRLAEHGAGRTVGRRDCR